MGRFLIEGPSGARVIFEVPGPGVDQRTFDLRVESGDWTVLERLDRQEDEPSEDVPDEPEPAPVEPVERPPESGPGSSRKAWAAYAESVGVDVADDDTRDDLIAKVDV